MTRLLLTVVVLVAGALPVPAASEAVAQRPRSDRYGDPLPKGAIARLGTLRLRGCRGPVVFSPDGKYVVAAGGESGTQAVFWDIGTGRRVKALTTNGDILRLTFSPDGKQLAVASDNGRDFKSVWSVWDVATSEKRFTFTCHTAAFSADGKTIISTEGIGKKLTVRFLDTIDGKQQSEGSFADPDPGYFTLSADGRFAAVPRFGNNPSISVFDLRKKVEVKKLFASEVQKSLGIDVGLIQNGNFSRDGRRLVASGGNGWAAWDWESGKLLCARSGQDQQAPAFSPDGRRLVWIGPDDRYVFALMTVDLNSDRPRPRRIVAMNSDGRPHPPTFSPDGKQLAVITAGDVVTVVDSRTGRDLLPLDAHSGSINSVAFALDARYVMTSDSVHLLVWEAATGRLLRRRPAADLDSPAATISRKDPNGRWRESSEEAKSRLQKLKLLDAFGRLAFTDADRTISGVLESPGGRYLVVAGQTKSPSASMGQIHQFLCLWDTVTRCLVLEFNNKHGPNRIMGFSSDARTLISKTYSSGTIHLWETATGRERLRLVGHMLGEVKVSFRADGRVLVSGGEDTQVFLWDVTGRTPDGVRRPIRHSPEQLRALWKALAGDDATEAYRALWALVDAPSQTVVWIREHLPPVALVEARQLSRLIADLDSDEFTVRTKASEELERLGELAEMALRGALAGRPTLECRRRCEGLLAKLSVLSSQRLRSVRAVEVLEHVGTAEARDLLEKWRHGAPQARLTQEADAALKRLAALPAAAP